jgi:hypothetical protein
MTWIAAGARMIRRISRIAITFAMAVVAVIIGESLTRGAPITTILFTPIFIAPVVNTPNIIVIAFFVLSGAFIPVIALARVGVWGEFVAYRSVV